MSQTDKKNFEFHKANLNYFNCHGNGTTYEVLTVPTEPKSFMSCGEDGTVRFFDLRQVSRQVCVIYQITLFFILLLIKLYYNFRCSKTCCKDNILILGPTAITAMSLAPISYNYIAVGSSDSHIRIYDRRYLSLIDFSKPSAPSEKHTVPSKAFTIPSIEKRPFRVTSLNYSRDETEVLVSYSSDHLYLFDITKEGVDVNSINEKVKRKSKSKNSDSPPPVRRLRLRGDWSDTGPDARPEREMANGPPANRQGPQLQASLMRRMTEALSRMISDPLTRANLNQIDMNLDSEQITEQMSTPDDDGENEQNSTTNNNDNNDRDDGPSTSTGIREGSLNPPNFLNKRKVPNTENNSDDSDDDDESDSQNSSSDNLKELSETPICINFDYNKMKYMGHRNAR